MPAQGKPKQLIRVGDQQLELPDGVSVADWGLEKVRVQNPRIRAYLGCIRLLEANLESNYALLHCSPRRLLTTWRKVREVLRMLDTGLLPTLKEPSAIADLERARSHALQAYEVLSATAISTLRSFPERLAEHDLKEVRRTLCVSMGKIHSFLRDTFGEIVAADPRSLHDADYYLSRKFQQEIDEAEWLYATVDSLYRYINDLWPVWKSTIERQTDRLGREGTLPPAAGWSELDTLLAALRTELTPRLRQILALNGIRFEEMQTIDQYAGDIPALCRLLAGEYELGRGVIEEIKAGAIDSVEDRRASVRALTVCHEEVAARILMNLNRLRNNLRDIVIFLPVWLRHIEKRRALMLTKNPDEMQSLFQKPAPEPPEIGRRWGDRLAQ